MLVRSLLPSMTLAALLAGSACTPTPSPSNGDGRSPTWGGSGASSAPSTSGARPPATPPGAVSGSGASATAPPMAGPPATNQPVSPPVERAPHPEMPAATVEARIRTGADVLAASGFEMLRGKRVGLIANHTTTVGGRHLADLLKTADGVRLVALFGPEHGIRGDADAGARIDDGRDAATGVPVYSLYGRNRKPTDEMLRDVDVLVYDVQDVGARFYTFISTMGLSMQSAAKRGIPFVVLDRPNPLGGAYVGGFTLAAPQMSFVGQFEIPAAYGMTPGELARMILGERLIDGLDGLDLQVVEMTGWGRDQMWTATGMPWVAPSPNLPSFEAALVYAGTCLVEGTTASEGRGTRRPFTTLGAVGVNADRLAADLNGRGLLGVRFRAARFTPVAIAGMSAEPKLKNQALGGVEIDVTDARRLDPVALGVVVLDAFLDARERNGPGGDRAAFFDRGDFFDKLAGTPRLRSLLTYDTDPTAILEAMREDTRRFDTRRQPYLLYR